MSPARGPRDLEALRRAVRPRRPRLHVEEGEIVSVIGPNGAGKSTLFNVITGLYRADDGDILFRGESIVGLTPNQITRLGHRAHVPDRAPVPEHDHARERDGRPALPVEGRRLRGRSSAAARTRREEQRIRGAARRGAGVLRHAAAGYRQDQPAFVLSYANRRRLEMARAMATEPALLLLDEPTAGMNPRETLELRDQIVRMRDERGLTIVVIEHDMRVVKGVSDRVVALRLRAEDRGGHLRRGRERRAGDRGLPGHEGGRMSQEAPAAVAPDGDAERRPVLELRDVSTHYGLVSVLRNVNVQIYPGRDGLPPRRQRQRQDHHPEDDPRLRDAERGRGPARRRGRSAGCRRPRSSRAGSRWCPENRRLFPHMTVAENLELGAYQRTDKAKIAEDLERVLETFPRVRERLKQKAGTLSGGEQQMVAMGRALMADPKVLLMDEPSMGLAPVLVEQVFEIIKPIRELGTDDLRRRAEREHGAVDRRPRLRPPDRPDRAGRHGASAAGRTRGCARRTWASCDAARSTPARLRRAPPDARRRSTRWRPAFADEDPPAPRRVRSSVPTASGLAAADAGVRATGASA